MFRRLAAAIGLAAAFAAGLSAAAARAEAPAPAGSPVEGAPVRSAAGWLRSLVPDELHRGSFLLENWQWLGLLLLVVVGLLVDRVTRSLLGLVAKRTLVRFLPDGDARVRRAAVRPAGMLAMALVWGSGLPLLGLPEGMLGGLFLAVKVVLAGSAVWLAYRFTDVIGEILTQRARQTSSRFDDLLAPMIRKSLKILILAFGLVFVADNLNVDISSLLAGLGLGGLALALAAQDTVKNLFGSITVLVDKPFAVGDLVRIGDVEGVVEEVGFRSTRVRTAYDSLITVPNANLISSNVDNLGARAWRRWRTTLSLRYDTPPERIESFCEGVRELVRLNPATRKDQISVSAYEFSASSVDVLLNVYFRTERLDEELEDRHRLLLDILRLARSLGVVFAFPTQTLHVHPSEWKPADADESADAVERAKQDARAKAAAIAAARGEA
ncbi:MAG: mechanosensitive ion channel family protein [Candidatus Eiseniibacteriota bacterium]